MFKRIADQVLSPACQDTDTVKYVAGARVSVSDADGPLITYFTTIPDSTTK